MLITIAQYLTYLKRSDAPRDPRERDRAQVPPKNNVTRVRVPDDRTRTERRRPTGKGRSDSTVLFLSFYFFFPVILSMVLCCSIICCWKKCYTYMLF
jgi:hypothetical protein